MRSCPFCEGEISNTAKKCKHCGEWVVEGEDKVHNIPKNDTAENDIIKSKAYYKKVKKDNQNNTNGSKSKLSTFLSDYGILIAIGAIILLFGLKPSNNQQNNVEKIQNDVEIDHTSQEYELVGNSEDIVLGENGFTILPNSLGECNIKGEKEIIKFVDSIRSAKDGDVIDYTCKDQDILADTKGTNVAFLFDNSYSEDLNGNIDKNGPAQRITAIGNYLTNRNFSNGTLLDFIFMFTVKPEDNSEEPDSNIYHFKIDTSKFTPIYIKNGDGEPFYDDKRKTLIYRNVELSASLSGGSQNIDCISNSNIDFVCYDANSVYKKILDIYGKEYDKEDKHTNNMFIKTLAMNNGWFLGNKDDVYIFSDGEFRIGYERETMYLANLKDKYKKQRKHDAGADKTHNLTEFNMRYANRYQKDSKYESFWTDAIDVLRPQIPVCEGVKIHVIGITRSTEFKPLAEKIYKQIFSPCEVLFQ